MSTPQNIQAKHISQIRRKTDCLSPNLKLLVARVWPQGASTSGGCQTNNHRTHNSVNCGGDENHVHRHTRCGGGVISWSIQRRSRPETAQTGEAKGLEGGCSARWFVSVVWVTAAEVMFRSN